MQSDRTPPLSNAGNIIARFVSGQRWTTLPDAVKWKAKACFLDALSAGLSGSRADVSKIATNIASRLWPGDEATILLHTVRANTIGAAFANGCAANAYDSDDGALYTKGHPGAQIFPTVLAIAERDGKSGADLLTALIIGYEVAMRAGRCWHDYHSVYQACGSWGSLACTAAAANLMELEEDQVLNALGIADYYAPNLPMMRDIDHPTMVKHGIGWGAMTGIVAAELAAMGFTGTPCLLEFTKYKPWVNDLGKNYLMERGVTFKEFSSCAWSHAPLLAAQQLIEKETLRPDEIERIRIHGFHETVRLGSGLPTSSEEAQFNTGWPLVSYLLYGEVSPRQMSVEHLDDTASLDLLDKIDLVESEQFSSWARNKWVGKADGRYASRLEIWLKDDRYLDSGIASFCHDYGANWDNERIEQKFRWLVDGILPEGSQQRILALGWSLDDPGSLQELIALIRQSKGH